MVKGNKLRKLNRPPEQRVSMLRNLAKSLILHESIVTTSARGKALTSYFDKLLNTAKKNNDASLRLLKRELGSDDLVRKLSSVLTKKFADRNSGYCAKYLLEKRSGDNAQMIKVQFKVKENE